ncbi:hypothetical protein EVG20_g1425 [Dentipellis fragilis]|uniref:Uncharacterized protein n=1 Tax=Dentipellis fragilis TaxID=205917 RepID=A0A4Y9ZBS5_9AGAM|nr:hypothetical protein EVG20_g1425 [Dentipellis fragilis]
MPAVASSSRHPRPRQSSAPRTRWNVVIGGPATRAYGFMLDDECIGRWAPIIYEEIHDAKMPASDTEDGQAALMASCQMVTVTLPTKIYREFPNIPRLWRRMIPFSGEGYLFVLKDNRSRATRKAELDAADVEGIRRKLGLGARNPKWYDIPV